MDIQQIVTWLQENVFSSNEMGYIALIVVLFILPRFLSRYGIPSALSAFFLGFCLQNVFSQASADPVIRVFSILGISSLFAFAGLEVDLKEIGKRSFPILEHVAFRLILVLAGSFAIIHYFPISSTHAMIVVLAITTPSVGFILESIGRWKLDKNLESWIINLAISTEITALIILLFAIQGGSPIKLLTSILVLALAVFSLPFIFRTVASKTGEISQGSDFTLIIILAVVMALISKALGAYYLIGAFLVGIVIGQYKAKRQDILSSDFIGAIRLFSSFFMPFYFFKSGSDILFSFLTARTFFVGFGFFIIFGCLRILITVVHRRIRFKEDLKDSIAVSVSILPNLVFGLVLASILRDEFKIAPDIWGGIIISTILTSIAPAVIFRLLFKNKTLIPISQEELEGLANLNRGTNV